MQLSILLSTTVLAALVSAQSLAGLPTCATQCIIDALPASCNLDPACICKSTEFIDGIGCCVFNACNTTDQESALAYAHGICDPVGASSLLPASAGCPSTSGSSNGTASATDSASTTATGSGSSSAATTTAAATGSAASSGSSVASSAASASAASATSTPAGAGDRIAAQGLGAVGAAMLGLAAFL